MRSRYAREKQFLEYAANSLRELGLGGSAVGTGINTHPDYREKGRGQFSRGSLARSSSRRKICGGRCSPTPAWARFPARCAVSRLR